jgi:hypothetical protein
MKEEKERGKDTQQKSGRKSKRKRAKVAPAKYS